MQAVNLHYMCRDTRVCIYVYIHIQSIGLHFCMSLRTNMATVQTFKLCLQTATVSFIHSFIHSFCSLSYDRSVASFKASSHRVRSSASSFNFQYLLFSLRSSSSYIRLLPRLPVISILWHSVHKET